MNPTFSRLDRFLYTNDWELAFKPHFSKTLQRTVYDHFRVVLDSPQIKWGSCPFRLNNASLKQKKFMDNIQGWWLNSIQSGHPGYSFIQRLKILANYIKTWQVNKVNRYEVIKNKILKEIDIIGKLEFHSTMTEIHHSKRISLKSDLHNIENKQAHIWHQRSRQNWNFFGDENNAFFHRMCSINQRKNRIKKIKDPNGSMQNSSDSITKVFLIIFKIISQRKLQGKS